MTAVVSRTNLDKMLSEKAVSKSENPAIHSAAVANIDHLFVRAFYGWNKPDRAGRPNIAAIHRFFAPMEAGVRLKMVKLTIKELADKHFSNTIYTLEVVDFADAAAGRQWLAASARLDGVDFRQRKTPAGEWEVEIAGFNESSPRTFLLGSGPKAAPLGIRETLAYPAPHRNIRNPPGEA